MCPDPEVLFGDAFSAEWKVHANKGEGSVIVPLWPSQQNTEPQSMDYPKMDYP